MVKLVVGAAAILLLLIVGPQLWVYSRYSALVYDDVSQVPPASIAIVFGAGLRADGSPSKMLADRVEAAVVLYEASKVERLLMSGDGLSTDYDEVTAMKRLAEARGVPASRILVDPAGLRTHDSSYRARAVFDITEAILVSQAYHLPRALYFADSFGIKAVGFKAGQSSYSRQAYYNLREAASLTLAWYEVNLTRKGPWLLKDSVDAAG